MMIRVCNLFIIAAAAWEAACPPASAAPPATCATIMPVQMRGPQPRWPGNCVNGKAEGVGLLRVGVRQPFGFFFGRIIAGRARTGLVMLASGNMMDIRGVDDEGVVLLTDGGNAPEQDRAWEDAAAGGRLVARRFAAARNADSAACYARWAHRIETQRQE